MKSIILLLSVVAFFQMSCNQDSLEPNLPSPGTSKIKKEYSDTEFSDNIFDDQGRVTVSKYDDGYRDEYIYHPDYIERREIAPNDSLTAISTFELNDKGLVFKSTDSHAPGSTSSYFYNDSGQIVKTIWDGPNGKFECLYTYQDGNVAIAEYKLNGVIQYTYKYSYYTDLVNGLGHDNYGQMYLGKDNKNLLKTWDGFGSDGNIYYQLTYAYTLDDMGRVVKQEWVGSSSETWRYEY